MLTKVRGLIIRTVDIKETDRLVTIFTEEQGVVTALARGARSLKSRKMSATILFCYGDYVLYGQGDKQWIKEAELLESFYDMRDSIEGLALANYIVEILSDVTVAEAERDLLRLALNSLFAISRGKYTAEKIKAAFEVRAATILGFMPDVLSCHECGERLGDFFLDVMGGVITCRSCRDKAALAHTEPSDPHEAHIICLLSEGAKTAFGYCVYSPIERIFSFNLSDTDMHLFSRAAEEYLLNQLGRGYNSLAFYKSL